MEKKSLAPRSYLSIAAILIILSGYTFFAGSVDSRYETGPSTLNGRLRQIGGDLMDYHSHFEKFPSDLETIRAEFGRTESDYWDVYSHGSNQPFGFELVRDGLSESCLLYTARLEEPSGIVRFVSGELDFLATDAYEALRRNEPSYESRGIAIWDEAPVGEKVFYYILLPHRLFEWHFLVNR